MIRLTDLRYGPGYFQTPGSVVELSREEEAALVSAKRAEWVQTASQPPQQTASKQPHKGKRK